MLTDAEVERIRDVIRGYRAREKPVLFTAMITQIRAASPNNTAVLTQAVENFDARYDDQTNVLCEIDTEEP
jgi:hypothetical protein